MRIADSGLNGTQMNAEKNRSSGFRGCTRQHSPIFSGGGLNPQSAIRNPQLAGFTLLEVLVATALVGIAAAALMSGLSGSLRNLSRAEGYEKAVLVARAQMSRLLIEEKLKPGRLEDRWDESYRWEAEVAPWDPGGRAPVNPDVVPEIAVIKLRVFWKGVQGEKQVTLETCKYQGWSPPQPIR
ncbi:MAG: prepilin-type N-terminal cleavage/methylation domain-containing protein [Acidobacteria bacterium]|jgi:type II secretion system protein I|nr:prepilin-type N-terminal cleavage/methylation domain-containing protein [Acidobacteriota bacterium]